MTKMLSALSLAVALVAPGLALAAEKYEVVDQEKVLIKLVDCPDAKAKAIDNLTIDVPVAQPQG